MAGLSARAGEGEMRLERVPGAGSRRTFKGLDFFYPEGSGDSVEVLGKGVRIWMLRGEGIERDAKSSLVL